MTPSRLPLTLTGAASKADCCAALCDYRVEAVEVYLDIVLSHERKGTDPVEPLRRRSRDRTGSTADGDGDERIWDVQQAVKALRAERREVTTLTVAMKLCPWSIEG